MKCTCGKYEIGEIDFDFIYYFSEVELQRQNNFLLGIQWVNDSRYKTPFLC